MTSGNVTASSFAIIICTRNRADLLGRCLDAILREANSVDDGGEIILVDNGSTDSTREVFAIRQGTAPGHTPFRYLFEPRPGLSLARNRGLDSTQAEILIFLDDDAIPKPGWLASCLAAFASHPRAVAIGGEILPLLSVAAPSWFRPPLSGYYTVVSFTTDGVIPYPRPYHPVGANMAFRRAALEKLRFNEGLGPGVGKLMGSDETEIFGHIRRKRGEVLYVPDMRVEHHIHAERLTEAWILDRYYYEGISRARMRLGWPARLLGVAKSTTMLTILMVRYPFSRSEFRWLVWRCQARKAWGYLGEFVSSVIRLR